jgi:hypothetical protein
VKAATRDRLYVIDRTVRKIVNVLTVLFFVLLIAGAFDTPWQKILVCAFFVVGGIWLLLILCRGVFSHFVKSDEEEEMEAKVEYILKKYHASELQLVIEDYTPLHDLTPEQAECVKRLLREQPSHANKTDHINLANIAKYLTALEQLNKADLNDKRNLRMWVAQITGKKVPSPSQFNEAIPAKAKDKVAKARDELSRLLQ